MTPQPRYDLHSPNQCRNCGGLIHRDRRRFNGWMHNNSRLLVCHPRLVPGQEDTVAEPAVKESEWK